MFSGRVRGRALLRCASVRMASTVGALPGRVLLRVHGEEAAKLLHNLSTADVLGMAPRSCRAAALLHPGGRVLSESILYRLDDGPSYLVEVAAASAPAVRTHMLLYRLRLKVAIDGPDLVGLAPTHVLRRAVVESAPETVDPAAVFADPRHAALGWRMLLPASDAAPNSVVDEDFLDAYTRRRWLLGVPEGPEELPPGVALPQESNLDRVHAISYRKGCYLGQELVSRVYHTGVVRKRLAALVCVPRGADGAAKALLALPSDDVFALERAISTLPMVNPAAVRVAALTPPPPAAGEAAQQAPARAAAPFAPRACSGRLMFGIVRDEQRDGLWESDELLARVIAVATDEVNPPS